MPFKVTSKVAPTSARTAIHSVAIPGMAKERKTSFRPRLSMMFCLMTWRVVLHEYDIGGFHSLGRTAAAHRDTDVCSRQRGGIIDAVSDHRNCVFITAQFFDCGELLFRQ